MPDAVAQPERSFISFIKRLSGLSVEEVADLADDEISQLLNTNLGVDTTPESVHEMRYSRSLRQHVLLQILKGIYRVREKAATFEKLMKQLKHSDARPNTPTRTRADRR
jgi:hypothetical protein